MPKLIVIRKSILDDRCLPSTLIQIATKVSSDIRTNLDDTRIVLIRERLWILLVIYVYLNMRGARFKRNKLLGVLLTQAKRCKEVRAKDNTSPFLELNRSWRHELWRNTEANRGRHHSTWLVQFVFERLLFRGNWCFFYLLWCLAVSNFS